MFDNVGNKLNAKGNEADWSWSPPEFPYPIKDGSEKNVSESAVPLARLRTEAPEHRRVTPKLKDIV